MSVSENYKLNENSECDGCVLQQSVADLTTEVATKIKLQLTVWILWVGKSKNRVL